MIAVIGEAPVNTLGGTAVPITVVQAENVLDETNRAVQSEGWHFNTEYEYELTPDAATSKITLPGNTLKVDLDPEKYTNVDAVQRGLKLYDRKNHTDVWSGPIKATITFQLDFTETPEQIRHYVTIKAARIFSNRFLGSREIEGFTVRDEIEAKARAIDHDSETTPISIFDNYAVLRVIDR